jgi:hypothetical protein
MQEIKKDGILCLSLSCALVFVLANKSVYTQKNSDVCRVTTSIWSIEEKLGTGIYEVGKFPVDDFDDGAKKVLRYEDEGDSFSITAEVEYGDFHAVEKGKPNSINLSLLVVDSNESNKVWDFSAVKGGTDYRYKWGTVFVRKNMVKGDKVFTFTLTCSDGLSKNGVHRGQPNWMKKIKG